MADKKQVATNEKPPTDRGMEMLVCMARHKNAEKVARLKGTNARYVRDLMSKHPELYESLKANRAAEIEEEERAREDAFSRTQDKVDAWVDEGLDTMLNEIDAAIDRAIKAKDWTVLRDAVKLKWGMRAKPVTTVPPSPDPGMLRRLEAMEELLRKVLGDGGIAA